MTADEEGAEDGLDRCLEGFPDSALTGSAESPTFTRADAMAWSAAWALADEGAALEALQRLGSRDFAACFTATLGPVDELTPQGPGWWRARFVLGSPPGPLDGGGVVHLDLLAAGAGRVVALLALADAPGPFPADEVAARVADRLRGSS